MGLFSRKHQIRGYHAVRDELDDHLDAINENADELAEVRDSLCQLDEKLEKLSCRIDDLYLLLGAETALTSAEAALQAFLQTPRGVGEIAAFLNDTAAAAQRVLRTLCLKGVAVHTFAAVEGIRYTTNASSMNHISLNNYF